MKTPERKEREAAALRANLLKRKDQLRRRSAGVPEEKDPPEPEDKTNKEQEE